MFNIASVHHYFHPSANQMDQDLELGIKTETKDKLYSDQTVENIDLTGHSDSHLIDILDQDQTPQHYDFEKLNNFISQLKAYDQSLKVLKGVFKMNGMKQALNATKELRNFVKYIGAANSLHSDSNPTDELFSIQIMNQLKDPTAFKKMTETVSNMYSIISQSTAYLEQTGALEFAITHMHQNYAAIKPHLSNFLSAVAFPQNEIILLCKIASLRSTIQYWQKDEPNTSLTKKNLVLLRNSLETARSIVKVGTHLTGYDHPYLRTALTVSSIFTGTLGAYFIYNDQRNDKKQK